MFSWVLHCRGSQIAADAAPWAGRGEAVFQIQRTLGRWRKQSPCRAWCSWQSLAKVFPWKLCSGDEATSPSGWVTVQVTSLLGVMTMVTTMAACPPGGRLGCRHIVPVTIPRAWESGPLENPRNGMLSGIFCSIRISNQDPLVKTKVLNSWGSGCSNAPQVMAK